jgi:TonB family protein
MLHHRTPVAALACSSWVLLIARSLGETPPDKPASIEVYKAPQPINIEIPPCDGNGTLMGGSTSAACRELVGGTEGWVELAFMVDPAGKPFEVTVTRSTGDRNFEKAATRAIERSTFEPGSLNGKPIESGYELKYLFVSDKAESYPGASHAFAKADKALMQAIAANDRAAADAALKGLKITNLYEDAYFGLANYSYAAKWGDASQQLAGLRRAIAEENLAHYLPQDAFRSALLACMELELNAHEYAEALMQWNRLQKLGIDKATQVRIGPIFEQLAKLRADGSAYEVSGDMPEGDWHLHLFKRHFEARVIDGQLTQVKLRCERGHVFFAFEPKLQYRIPDLYGECNLELDGAPGSRFKLVQF